MLNATLPGWLLSYCLVGSAALGAFDGRFSDVDFVAAVSRTLTESEMGKLQSIHRELGGKRSFAPLDGLYVPIDAFGGNSASCLRFNEGSYLGHTGFNPHSPDAWVLKRHGVCLCGVKPEVLPFAPEWNLIRAGVLENLNAYWRNWVGGCRRAAPKALGLSFRQDMLEWGVLGITRLYYSLREGDITSKTGAGEYALQSVSERWRPIILEAMRRRDSRIPRQMASPFRRYKETLDYMEFIIGVCNNSRS